MSTLHHLRQIIIQGKVSAADLRAELDDINKVPTGTIIQEAYVLDLLDALNYAQQKEANVSDLEKVPTHLKQQYVSAYGEYFPGEHRIGDQVSSPTASGEIIWSYRSGGSGPVTYVIDDESGFPCEVQASDVRS